MLFSCNGGSQGNAAAALKVKYETKVLQPESAEEKSVHLDTRVNALQEAFYATSELMNHGSTTYLEVLTAQESLLAAQLEQVSNQYDLIVSMVDLYSALGGFGQEL